MPGGVRLLAALVLVAVAVVAVLVFGLATVVGEDDVATTAAFELSTASATPGDSLTASDDGWSPGEAVTFRYGPGVMGTCTADSDGAFTKVRLALPS